MSHEKKIKDLLVSPKDNKVPGDTIISGVSVKSAAAKINTAPSEGSGRGSGKTARESTPGGGTSEDPAAGASVTKPPGGNGDDEHVDGARGSAGGAHTVNSRGGGLWLAVVPVIGIGLIAILAALIGRGDDKPHAVVEDDGSNAKECQPSSRFGYKSYATSQAL
jgi:hypothetical protein